MSPANAPASSPSTPRTRLIKVTTRFREVGYWRRESRVPFIRLSGNWLAAMGFTADSRVVVQSEPGRLTLTLQSPGPREPNRAG